MNSLWWASEGINSVLKSVWAPDRQDSDPVTSELRSCSTEKSLLKRPLFLHKESDDISIFVSETSFLNILKRMVQRLEGFCVRGPRREQIFYRIYSFQTKIQCFHAWHWIFCKDVIYMVLLRFWHLFHKNCLNTFYFSAKSG